MLTDTKIKHLRPKDKPYELIDEGNRGLRVRVSMRGRKTFIYRYSNPHTGKLSRVMLGEYPDLTLENARSQWRELRQLRNKKIDPKTHLLLEAEKARVAANAELQKQANSNYTVSKLVKVYVDDLSTRSKRWSELNRTLNRELIPRYGNTPAADLTRAEMQIAYNEILARGRPAMARQFVSLVSTMFRWALVQHEIPVNTDPTLGLNMRKKNKPRARYLLDAELKLLFKNMPNSKLSKPQQNLLTFILLTGCRIREAATMLWTEVFLEDSIWRQPEGKTKNGHEYIVLLSSQAKALLQRQDRVTGIPYVWAAPQVGVKHLRPDTVNTSLNRALGNFAGCDVNELEVDHFTPHDFRRSISTWLAKSGYDVGVRDRMLNHVNTSSIDATYTKHSYDEEAKGAWQAWADHLEGLGYGK